MRTSRIRPIGGERGFTLLEVLVAMAILSIGLIAVFSGMSQSLSATTRLRDKTMATWIATDRITELQVTGEYPDAGNRRDEIEMANTQWVYEMKISNFPEVEMRRIDITVSLAESPDDVLGTVIGFIGPPQTPASAPGTQNPPAAPDSAPLDGFGSGWEPPREDGGAIG